MDEKRLRAEVDAGAVKRVRILAGGSCLHVEAETQYGSVTTSTLKGAVKIWVTLDATASTSALSLFSSIAVPENEGWGRGMTLAVDGIAAYLLQMDFPVIGHSWESRAFWVFALTS